MRKLVIRDRTSARAGSPSGRSESLSYTTDALIQGCGQVALRLREPETLQKITEKIGNISVYGGLDSVMNELVRIKR